MISIVSKSRILRHYRLFHHHSLLVLECILLGELQHLRSRACACMGIPALQPSALCLKGWRPIGMSLLGSEGSQGHLPSKLKLRRQVGTCGVWTGTWTTGSGCPPGPPPPPVAPVLPVTSPASPSPYKSFGFFCFGSAGTHSGLPLDCSACSGCQSSFQLPPPLPTLNFPNSPAHSMLCPFFSLTALISN